MTFVLMEPLVLAFVAPVPLVVQAYKPLESLVVGRVIPEPLVQEVLPLEQLLPASVLVEPLVLAVLPLVPLVQPSMPLEALVLAVLLLEQLPASVLVEPLVLVVLPLVPLVQPFMPLKALVLAVLLLKPPALAFRNLDPLVLGLRNLKKLPVVTKNHSSSSLTGVSSQIAHPGRSGIILKAKTRFPRSWGGKCRAQVKGVVHQDGDALLRPPAESQ